MLDKEEEKFAVCKDCEKHFGWGGTSVKNYNTINLSQIICGAFTISDLMSLLLKSVTMQRRKRTRKKKPMGKTEKTRRSTLTYLRRA